MPPGRWWRAGGVSLPSVAAPLLVLPAGLLILQGASQLLGAPLQIGRGGLREGVLLEASRA